MDERFVHIKQIEPKSILPRVIHIDSRRETMKTARIAQIAKGSA